MSILSPGFLLKELNGRFLTPARMACKPRFGSNDRIKSRTDRTTITTVFRNKATGFRVAKSWTSGPSKYT